MSLTLLGSSAALNAEIRGQAERAWSRPISLPEEDRSCHLCARHRAMSLKLDGFFRWPIHKDLPPDTYFGRLSDIIEHSDWCNFCKLIAESVSHTMYSQDAEVLGCWIIDGVLKGSKDVGESDSVSSLRLRIVPEMHNWENAFKPFDIIPLLNDPKAHAFSGRTIEQDHFSLPLVKSWVANCDNWHDSCLEELGQHSNVRWDIPFIRLLDLEADAIVEIPRPERYVILSYIWGTAPVFQTTRETLPSLKEEGALLKRLSEFPETIRDSITMTKALGIRYLWVDSFCIVQDDTEDKKIQIAAMDQIYSKAYLTIVAAGGEHADAGLLGIWPGSRNILQRSAVYSESLTLTSIQLDASTAANASEWNTRGWTYQERVLSHRCLIFVNGTVYFQCSRAVWGEDYRAEYPDLVQCAPMYDYSLSRNWQQPLMHRKDEYRLAHVEASRFFPEYCKIVAEYTSRTMTYASDRINGVNGILTELTRQCQVTFTCGLPEQDSFHESLLWQPTRSLRRVPVDPNSEMPLFPTWTWAGWVGGVVYIDPSDFNGNERLEAGQPRTISHRKLEICYRDPADFPCLCVLTSSARFKLTLLNKSGRTGRLRGLTRFGITYAPHRSASDGPDSEPWLGSILLPNAGYRTKLSQTHEFISVKGLLLLQRRALRTGLTRRANLRGVQCNARQKAGMWGEYERRGYSSGEKGRRSHARGCLGKCR